MTNLIDLITPINLQEEGGKFLTSPTYHPIFHYRWQDSLSTPTFSIKLKYHLWEAILVQDHKAIVTAAKNLFEVNLSDTRLAEAKQLANIKGDKAKGNAEEYAQMLRAGLTEFGLDDINVIL